MKSYTDIEQSKKLVKILPLESADMYYSRDETTYAKILTKYEINYANVLYGSCDIRYFNICEHTPCWSLAALIDILPNNINRYTKSLYWFDDAWHCEYVDEDSEGLDGTSADNPIDACYEMIIHLHELKML